MEKNRVETNTKTTSSKLNGTSSYRSTVSTFESKPHLTMMSWRAIIAGFFISILASLVLTSLGVGVGGIALTDLEAGPALRWGAAAWMTLTIIASLFAGSYVASRVSNFLSREVGMAQGATIAALFFVVSIWGGGMFVGSVARSAAVVARGVASVPVGDMAKKAYQNPQVRGAVNDQIRELGIAPARVDDVIGAALSKLLDGDTDGAERVILANTNIDPQIARQKIESLKATVDQYAKDTAKKAAKAMAVAGLYMFVLLILGGGFAAFGGVVGSRANVRHSLEEDELLRVA
jgi:hypothetical protein